MLIVVHTPFEVQGLLRLADVLVQISVAAMVERPLPLLYESGVIYRREVVETWRIAEETLRNGWEDCDSLAIWRAAELRALGAAALAPHHPAAARAAELGLTKIPAQCFFTQRLPDDAEPTGGPGAYHVVVRYQVDDEWFIDDPSARLGMRSDLVGNALVEPAIWARWGELGLRDRVVAYWRKLNVPLFPSPRATPTALARDSEAA